MMTKPERTEAEESFILQLRAAQITIRQLETKVADLREESARYLAEVRALHLEYVTELCDTCNGSGVVTEIEWGTTSNSQALSPPEIPVEVVCDACLGTRKEWGV